MGLQLFPALHLLGREVIAGSNRIADLTDGAVQRVNSVLAELQQLLHDLALQDERLHEAELIERVEGRAKRSANDAVAMSATQIDQAMAEFKMNQEKAQARQNRFKRLKLPFYGHLDWSWVTARVRGKRQKQAGRSPAGEAGRGKRV